MKIINLTNSTEFCAFVSDEDYELVTRYKWSLTLNRAKSTKKINGKYLFIHQLIFLNELLENPKLIIKHLDGDFLNCTRGNLKIITAQEKSRIKHTTNNKTSIYRGVSFDAKSCKWRASIKIDKKQINLGTFEFEIDAAKEYDKAAKQNFGKLCVLNFPEE